MLTDLFKVAVGFSVGYAVYAIYIYQIGVGAV